MQGDRVQALAVAGFADQRAAVLGFGLGPARLLAGLLLVEFLELHAGAEAVLAPAMFAVEREQARVELGEAGAAGRAGALDTEHLHLGFLRFGIEHVDQALAQVQRLDEVSFQ